MVCPLFYFIFFIQCQIDRLSVFETEFHQDYYRNSTMPVVCLSFPYSIYITFKIILMYNLIEMFSLQIYVEKESEVLNNNNRGYSIVWRLSSTQYEKPVSQVIYYRRNIIIFAIASALNKIQMQNAIINSTEYCFLFCFWVCF